MELKALVVLAVLGAVSGYTIPDQSSFASSYTENNPSSAPVAHLPEDEGTTRDKRHLLFKKYKKGKGEYEQGVVGYDANRREVHHHHHYSNYQRPSYVEERWEPAPRPTQPDYHQYHGYNEGSYAHQGSGYYAGGYSGGYGQNGPPQQSGPVGAAPVGQSHNNVDRGQGAAAVNNIAIIHARAGTSAHQHGPDNEQNRSVDFDQLSREALGMD